MYISSMPFVQKDSPNNLFLRFSQRTSHLLAMSEVLDWTLLTSHSLHSMVHEQRSLPQGNCSSVSSFSVLIGVSFSQESLLITVFSLKSYYRNNFKPKTTEEASQQTLAVQPGSFTLESTSPTRLHLSWSQHLAILKREPTVSRSKCP